VGGFQSAIIDQALVAAAVRFVFRGDVAPVRKVTSSYQRERVARARKGKEGAEPQTDSVE